MGPVMPSTACADRYVLVSLWNASTAKVSSHTPGSGRNLEAFCRWAMGEFGGDEVCAVMRWTAEDVRRLTSTGFGEAEAKLRPPSVRARGIAAESARRWNGYGGTFGVRSRST